MVSFENAIQAGNVVLLLGSGVSAAASGGSPAATWEGLIRAGIDYAIGRNPRISPEWRATVEQMLDYGVTEADAGFLVKAADLVAGVIKGVGDVAYANWLAETIGRLEVQDASLIKALDALPFPILTTNYDTLLEDATERRSTTWKHPTGLQSVLMRGSRDVAHLHGVWSEPDSVILTESDYGRVLGADGTQHLQRAASSLSSIVYIGFGSGLNDPNFGRVRGWYRRTFPQSTATHFRLCRDVETAALRLEHADENIEPVPYGPDHQDLPRFLARLAVDRSQLVLSSSGIAINPLADAQAAMAQSIVAELLIVEDVDDHASVRVDDVVVPPILLPVPHPEYVKARKKRSAEVSRLDPEQEVREAETIVVVGDDDAGVTTAIKWMAWKAAINLGGAAPLYVNFKACHRRPAHPLDEVVRAAAWEAGVLPGKQAELPPFVLALDDFSPYVKRVSEKVISDLGRRAAVVTIIGCRQGMEDDVVTSLRAVGLQPRTRFLGRMGSDEIRQLAKYVSPAGCDRLTRSVLDVLQRENLPRTPLSVSLLLAVLARGGLITTGASQTAILDQYVSLLLGRGDPHEDARLGIEQVNREALLASLAEYFVNRHASAVPEEEVVAELRRVIEVYGWKESATVALTSFIERRVLRRAPGGFIVFGRSSYLYLFAAKRVSKSAAFRARLVDHALFYAPILKDHAALVRHDTELLANLRGLLDYAPSNPDESAPFAELDLVDAPDTKEVEGSESDGEPQENDGDEAGDEVDVWFNDLADDEDRLPVFPGEDPAEMPAGLRMLRALDLVSTVLRDSDEIEDLHLKQEVLEEALRTWGSLIPFLYDDSGFRAFARTLALELEADGLIAIENDDEREAFLREFHIVFPSAMSLGGVSAVLASRKLVTVFERALSEGSLTGHFDARIGGAFFAFGVQEPGWPAQVALLFEGVGNRWIIRDFMLYQLLDAYYRSRLSESDAQDLLDLCVEVITRAQRYKTDGHRHAHAAELRQDLKRRRLVEQGKALGARSVSPRA